MPLVDSSRAIGEVAELLRTHLTARSGLNVTVGRPEPPNPDTSVNPRFNLFLYEASHEGTLRNLPLDPQQNPPLWLAVRFLITAFDEEGESDSIAAYRHLGDGLRILHELNYVSLDGLNAAGRQALENNPEPLKITFADASSSLLSTLMQGSDEKYRFSMAFEVRPVMIAPREESSYGLLVGIDYSSEPSTEIGRDGVRIEVFANLGMRIDEVDPALGTAGIDVTLSGENLETDNVVARLGPVELPVISVRPGAVRITLDPATINGSSISAGSHPLTLVKKLPAGRERSSNLRAFDLLPTVTSVAPLTFSRTDPADSTSPLAGEFRIDGTFLGSATDDVFVALHNGSRAVAVFDDLRDPPGVPAQTQRVVSVPESLAIPAGTYRVIVSVNGQQARQSPELTLNAP